MTRVNISQLSSRLQFQSQVKK